MQSVTQFFPDEGFESHCREVMDPINPAGGAPASLAIPRARRSYCGQIISLTSVDAL
jgi:hypothetical protein